VSAFLRGSCGRADLCDFKHEHVASYRVGYVNSPQLGVACFPPMGFPGDMSGMRALQYQVPVLSPQLSHALRLSVAPGIAAFNNVGPGDPLVGGMTFSMPPSISVVGLPKLRSEMRMVTSPTLPLDSSLSQQHRVSASRCRHWENGSCRLGNACTFRHDPGVPQKYRTKVCRHWEKGNCRVAENCNFAHPEKQ